MRDPFCYVKCVTNNVASLVIKCKWYQCHHHHQLMAHVSRWGQWLFSTIVGRLPAELPLEVSIHTTMSSDHLFAGLPRGLLPFTIPSITVLMSLLSPILHMWPKSLSFLCFIKSMTVHCLFALSRMTLLRERAKRQWMVMDLIKQRKQCNELFPRRLWGVIVARYSIYFVFRQHDQQSQRFFRFSSFLRQHHLHQTHLFSQHCHNTTVTTRNSQHDSLAM